MAEGYTSYEAFWIGGLSAPALVPPPPPPQDTGGGSIVGRGSSLPSWSIRDLETITEQRELKAQIEREDDELIGIMIAILKC